MSCNTCPVKKKRKKRCKQKCSTCAKKVCCCTRQRKRRAPIKASGSSSRGGHRHTAPIPFYYPQVPSAPQSNFMQIGQPVDGFVASMPVNSQIAMRARQEFSGGRQVGVQIPAANLADGENAPTIKPMIPVADSLMAAEQRGAEAVLRSQRRQVAFAKVHGRPRATSLVNTLKQHLGSGGVHTIDRQRGVSAPLTESQEHDMTGTYTMERAGMANAPRKPPSEIGTAPSVAPRGVSRGDVRDDQSEASEYIYRAQQEGVI